MQPFISRKCAWISKNNCKTKYNSSLHCQRHSSEMGHLEHILPELAGCPRPMAKEARVMQIYTSWNSAFPVTGSLPSFPRSLGGHMFFATQTTSLQVSWGWSVLNLLVYVVGLTCWFLWNVSHDNLAWRQYVSLLRVWKQKRYKRKLLATFKSLTSQPSEVQSLLLGCLITLLHPPPTAVSSHTGTWL